MSYRVRRFGPSLSPPTRPIPRAPLSHFLLPLSLGFYLSFLDTTRAVPLSPGSSNPSCFPAVLFSTAPNLPPSATRAETRTHLRTKKGFFSLPLPPLFLLSVYIRWSTRSFVSFQRCATPSRYLFPVIQKFATHPIANGDPPSLARPFCWPIAAPML